MRWKGRRESQNVEDRRSMRVAPVAIGGGLGALVLALVVMLLGGDPRALLEQAGRAPQGGQAQPAGGAGETVPSSPAEEEARKFVSVVLADTEDVWKRLFLEMGKTYREPKLVLFRDRVESACGIAGASVGPFYCPADQKVYIDLKFYDDLRQRFQAPGDFAQAYVIAHEIGHHVQNLLGISDEVRARQQRVGKAEANELSVRLELQADFLAGVWAHHAQKYFNILEPGDIEEALNAANAIGDDRLQKQAQGYVVPDSFTHGTSEQRARWFRRGLQSGDMTQGDTLSTRDL